MEREPKIEKRKKIYTRKNIYKQKIYNYKEEKREIYTYIERVLYREKKEIYTKRKYTQSEK